MTPHDALARLSSYMGSRYSAHTKDAYLRQAALFLRTCGLRSEYTRNLVLAYVDAMVRHGYTRQTIDVYLAGARALFRANNWTWPLVGRELHIGIPESENQGPVFEVGEVAALVAGAKRDGGRLGATIALSTLWGLRNTEIATVLSQGLNGHTLKVQTAKIGRTREHIIPARIAPLLTFEGHTIGRFGVHKVFERAMARYCREPRTREGWHAVRRSLITALVNAGLDRYILSKWVGWKVPETAFEYFRPAPKTLDEKVYAVHPYLPLWLSEEG